MIKKIAFVGVGLALLASPIVVSAQTVTASSNASLIAVLTQLVQLLEQELQQLQASLAVTAPSNGVNFTASPTSGTAPLSVSFTASGSRVAQGETVSFGDGTTGTLTQNPTPEYVCASPPIGTSGTSVNGNCQNPITTFSASHTYSAAGTYTATLTQGNCACPANGVCNCPNESILGTATITVTGSTQQSVSFTATPASGQAPLSVSFSVRGLSSADSYTIGFGDGSSGQLTLVYPPCAYGVTCTPQGNASHTYQSAGTYTATLYALPAGVYNAYSYSTDCPNGGCTGLAVGTATVTVTGSTNTSFTATPTSGSAPLTVTFGGTVPGTSYSLNFGDGSQPVLAGEGIECVASYPNCAANATISVNQTHTYATAGTYTATLTSSGVSNCPNGGCAPITATITVTGSTQASLTANPTSGAAPLTVTFSNVGGSIQFGDGSPGEAISDGGTLGQVTHTYASAGTYTATSGNSSVTIIVMASTQNVSFSGSPTSGTAPLSVTFLFYLTSNTQLSDNINFGDGSALSSNWGLGDAANSPAVQSHTYASAGTYTASLLSSSGATLASVTITASTPANPTVTYVSVSGSDVTASYTNLPAYSQIVLINQTSGQEVPDVNAAVSGSGQVTLSGLSGVPAGSFYLEAQSASGGYLAQSVVFYGGTAGASGSQNY